jgi:NCS1 family nucleobase:cation symporter-1
LGAILDRYWSGSTRFAVFLSAFTWMVSILGTNIAANMIPFGSDSSMLVPRFLTIPRGQYLVEFLAFAICPWKILSSASVFTLFLSGYGLFMASVVAIMICDCKFCDIYGRVFADIFTDFLLTKGNVFVGHLYNGSKTNKHYYYHMGWNIQGVIAYLCGIALPFPGFVGTLGAKVSTGATDLGRLGWLLSFTVSFVVYYVICLFWPTRNQVLIKEMGLGWEEASGDRIVAEDGTEIVEEGRKVYAVGEVSDDGVGREEFGVDSKY